MSRACGNNGFLFFSSQLWTKVWCWKSAPLAAVCPYGTPPAQRSASKSAARPFFHPFFFYLAVTAASFQLLIVHERPSFPLWWEQIVSFAQAERKSANLRRGHKKPLGAALWMIWYTRCGYSSVDAVVSADYCRFDGRGILKRAFQCGTKPRSNCNTLSIFCVWVCALKSAPDKAVQT